MTDAMEMERLEQIQETLAEIKERTPNVHISTFVDDVLAEDSLGTEYAPPEWKSGDAAGDGRRAEERSDDAGPYAPALKMDWAACVLPLHGEDAYFGHAEAGVVGVADGVGGYRDQGVDAGAFARALMANALATAERVAKAGSLIRLCPMKVLERAYKNAAMNETPGGSTAVILSLYGTELSWAYIGDSAFAVFRGGKIIYRSEQQQRGFNEPYQLSTRGRGGSLADAKVGGMSTVKEGDVVVIATDGLFDNMHDWQLERAVRMGTDLGFSSKNMADIVAGIGYELSKITWGFSPYGIGYFKKYKKTWHGGKKDDITVIVAYIISKD